MARCMQLLATLREDPDDKLELFYDQHGILIQYVLRQSDTEQVDIVLSEDEAESLYRALKETL